MPTVAATLTAVAGVGAPRVSLAKYTRTFDPTRAIWAVRMVRYNPNTGLEELFFYSNKNLFTAWGADASTYFSAILMQPALVSRTAFDDHTTQGRGRFAVGSVVLKNLFGALDYLQSYPVDGRGITVYLGQENASFPSGFQVVFDGTMEQELIGQDTSVVKIRDWQRATKVPLQTTVYAGDNVAPDGLEGEEDLKDKPKPVLMGSVRNAEPRCVNVAKQIYQIHDGAIASLSAVYDSALALGAPTEWELTLAAAFGFAGQTLAVLAGDSVMLVGTSSTGDLLYSGDGTSWTAATESMSGVIRGFATDGAGTYVAVGDGADNLAYSTDGGQTWTNKATGHTTVFYAVHYSARLSLWIAVGDSGACYTASTVTGSWTSRTSQFTADAIRSIAESDTTIVLVGDAGKISTSTNGTSYTARNSSNSANFASRLNTVRFGATRFRIAGDDGVVLNSDASGEIWAREYITFDGTAGGTSYDLSGLAYGAGYWVLGGITKYFAVCDTDDGPWTIHVMLPSGVPGGGLLAADYGQGRFLGAFGGTGAGLSVHGDTFASLADLEDDTLAPEPGNWKVYLAGGYFRLGAMPVGRITCDPVQDASFTAADGWAASLVRAGYVSGTDFSASDVSTRAAANTAQTGKYTLNGDKEMCADWASEFAQTDGSMEFADMSGVMRLIHLDAPATNLVTNPSDLASSPWAQVGGTVFAINDAAVYVGKSFSRISDADTGAIRQVVTLPSNGTYYVTFYVRNNGGVTGTFIPGEIIDATAAAARVRADLIMNADGSVTVSSVSAGSLVRLALLPGGDNVYAVTLKATGCIAANTNHFYADNGGTCTSLLLSDFLLVQGDPDATLSSLDGTTGEIIDIQPVPSSDVNGGLPVNRSVVRYSENYTPLFGVDIGGGVSDSDRALFGKEWLDTATALDSAVVAAHPLSIQRVDDSLYTTEANASDEADRRQALFGVRRYWFDVVCLFTDTTAAIEIGDVVEIVTNRFLMGAGVRFRVLGIKPDAAAGRITFQCWR